MNRLLPQKEPSLRSAPLILTLLGLALCACDDSSPRSTDPRMLDMLVTHAGENTALPAGEQGGESSGTESNGAEESGVEQGPISNRALRLEPREVVLMLQEGIAPPSQAFTVTLITDQEELVLDPSEITWQVTPGSLGVMVDGIFNARGSAGEAQVLAEYQSEIGSEILVAAATIRITASQDTLLEGISPEEVARFNQAPLSANCNIRTFLYPESFTTIPQNLQGFTFQWLSESDDTPYMITAQAGATILRWFTRGRMLTPSGIAWESAKVSGPNGLSTWSLSYINSEGERCDSPSLSLIVDPSQLIGAVYYWSTTDSGIMRLAAGETAPEPLLTPQTSPEINCPACHALSRDGTRIAFTRTTFPPFGEMATSSIVNPRTLNYDPSGVIGYFPSFSPDPKVLIAGNGGRLTIMDSDTGMQIEELPLPMGTVGGSPDWSWQGDRITAVVGPSGFFNPIPDVGISSGSIYEWVQQGQNWGEPTEVISPQGETWNTRPAYSPEGTFIAYNVEGPNPNMGDDNMGNPNVDLWLKRVGTDQAPIRLDRANHGSYQGNSWPKWSPYDRRGKLWLAFSSTRDYGHQLTQSNRSSPLPQIWVTAIDLDTPEGQDPSSPAFWLPYQSLNSGNHIPYWAPYEKR